MKILVIQTAFLGDIVLTTPLLKMLRKQFPKAEIHVLTTAQGALILNGLPGIVTYVLNKKDLGFFSSIQNVMNQIQASFDVLLCVHRSFRSLCLAKKISAKQKIAFESFWAKLFGFKQVKYPAYDEQTHYVDKPLSMLSALQVLGKPSLEQKRPWLEFDSIVLNPAVERFGKQNYIVISPFSVWSTKMWFADRYSKLAIKLHSNFSSAPIVLIGGSTAQEQTIAQTMTQKITAAGGRVENLVGKTDLEQLKSVIASAKLLVANDSAPVHIAAAFDVPTVAIFGPTVKKWGFFPLSSRSEVVERFDVACRPCSLHGPMRCPKKHFRCMNKIEVEDVLQAVQNVLK